MRRLSRTPQPEPSGTRSGDPGTEAADELPLRTGPAIRASGRPQRSIQVPDTSGGAMLSRRRDAEAPETWGMQS